MPYEFQSRIRYSEIGEDRKLTLPGLINYFQDCSTFQSEALGNGIEGMAEKKKVWVLAYWQIEVNRFPVLGERVKTQTWAHFFKGFQGGRNYSMLDEKGYCVASADSLWIYVDLQTGHPVRVDKEVQELYPLEPALDMERTSRKIAVPKDGSREEAFKVGRHHLDTNHHVNNAQYIAMAQEYLPKGWRPGRIRAEYKRQAVFGDLIYPAVYWEEDRMIIELCDDKEKPYAIVEFNGIR